MDHLTIRAADQTDAHKIAQFLRVMLVEMASTGGHPVSDDGDVWARLEENISAEIGKEDHVYFFAEVGEMPRTPIGFAEARLVSGPFFFQPRRTLHIHSLYVLESHRRRGIGRRLLETMFGWGRSRDCTQADLSVLAANPALALYEQVGFHVFELEMIADL
jgi:ribosomal protein S18 acetylase RimI-like enzyme